MCRAFGPQEGSLVHPNAHRLRRNCQEVDLRAIVGHDVGRVTDARTMSAVAKLPQEMKESLVVVVGHGMVSLSPRPADRGMHVDSAFQEKAGYLLGLGAKDTMSAMVKHTQEKESGFDVVGYGMLPTPLAAVVCGEADAGD